MSGGELRAWTRKGQRVSENERCSSFFFDLVDDKMIDDKKGVSLPSTKEARRYAVTSARELIETQQ